MARSRRLLASVLALMVSISLAAQAGMTVQAGSNKNYLDSLNGGVAAIVDPSVTNTTEVLNATAKQLNLDGTSQTTQSNRVMANVKSALNMRSEADESSDKVGMLYKDCGGTVLERKDGWTRLQSGNVIGWAKDEYLLFGEEADTLANDVGKMIAYMNDAVRIRKAASADAEEYGILPKGEVAEVVEVQEDGWIRIDCGGEDGYVLSDYVTLDFQIDTAESMEEIRIRQEAEKAAQREAKRHANYGEYTADADTAMLLAALIQCEAGGESYEGKLAVGAVVMNRVRSSAYPNSVHGVIYASGQFTPAMNGKVNRVYESGKISESCIQAAQDALAGNSNVGELTHFRRNNGRDGLVIGNHVFY